MLIGNCATLRRINLSICSAQRRKRSPFKSHQFIRPSVAYLQKTLRILKQRPPHRDEIELLAIEAADQLVEVSHRLPCAPAARPMYLAALQRCSLPFLDPGPQHDFERPGRPMLPAGVSAMSTCSRSTRPLPWSRWRLRKT